MGGRLGYTDELLLHSQGCLEDEAKGAGRWAGQGFGLYGRV